MGLAFATLVASSAPASALEVPTAPRSAAAIGGRTTGNMTVTWLAPTSLGGAGSVRYWVETAVDGGAFGPKVDVATARKKLLPCAGVNSCDFRVYAKNTAGFSPASNVATGTWAVPGKPTVGTVTGGPAVGKMALTIKAPASNGGQAITGYLYEVQVNSAGAWTGPFPLGTATPRVVDCASVTPTGGCNYRIYAVNSVGSSVVSANKAGLWNLPKAAQIISVTPGRPVAMATVNYQGPFDTGGLAVSYTYEVAVDGGAFSPGAFSLPTGPGSATVECPAGNNCSYRLTTHNAKGAGPVSNVVTTAFNPPGRVPPLKATVATVADLNLGSGDAVATVSWSAQTNTGGQPVTGYDGRACNGNCDDNNSAWSSATVVSLGNTNTWRPTCPSGQVTCSYEVRARNSIGIGPWGSSYRLTPFGVTNVTATSAAPAGNVTVMWSGPAEVGAGIDHIALYRCLTTAGCSNSANWSDTGLTITGNPQTVTHNCGQNVSCTYKIVAFGSLGAGASASSAASAATGSTLPDAPTALTATTNNTTFGAVNLAWTAPANSGTFLVTDYVFQRSINGGSFSAPISTGSNSTTYTDTACGASNSCTYQVAAVTSAGTGSYSNTATAEGANTPSAPVLSATPGSAVASVDLSWTSPTDNGGLAVSGYKVEKRSGTGPFTWTTIATPTSNSATDGACGAAVSCTYRVSAQNALGYGALSNEATALGTNLQPPQNLTAATSTNTLGGVLVTWQYPSDDGGVPIAGYEFRYKIGAGAFSAWASTGSGTGLSFTHVCGQAT
ncbi:MAG: fibronectin type III domain-containing protein, partial [Acidimicrobiia bacterium]